MINNILASWNLDFKSDEYIFDYLIKKCKQKCFYIDKFPLSIPDYYRYKYDQVNVFYQEIVDKNKDKEQFANIENRYKYVIHKLWMYNDIYIEYDPSCLISAKARDYIDLEYNEYLTLLENKMDCQEHKIINIKELDFWIQVGIRNVAFPIMYFNKWEFILSPCWSCYIGYLNNSLYYKKIDDIVVSEGLFVRSS